MINMEIKELNQLFKSRFPDHGGKGHGVIHRKSLFSGPFVFVDRFFGDVEEYDPAVEKKAVTNAMKNAERVQCLCGRWFELWLKQPR